MINKLFVICILFASSFALAQQADNTATQENTEAPSSEQVIEQLRSRPPQNRINLSAEAQAAKAHLEGVLIKRYSKIMSTFLDDQDYKVSFYLDLREVVKRTPSNEPTEIIPIELQVGIFDPELLLNGAASEEEAARIKSFLSSYSISNASLNIGIDENIDEKLKSQSESFVRLQFANEFGNLGTFSTSNLNQEKSSFGEKVTSLQQLLGSLLIALAIFVGAMMWKGAGAQNAAATQAGANAQPAQSASSSEPADVQSETTNKDSEDLKKEKEYLEFSSKVSDLAQQAKESLGPLLRAWCEKGKEGYFKLACFADAAGKSVGALPIPVEVSKDVGQVFVEMPAKSKDEKLTALKEVYWDIVAAINLGAESLTSPFSYLATSDVDQLQDILLEENEKLKALVGIHMPLNLRKTYMSTLDEKSKSNLLNEAANLGAMPASEYKEINDEFKAKLSGVSQSDQVAFDMAFAKLVEGLNVHEEMTLLPQIQGNGVDSFKRQVPTLAFVHEWPDDKLALVFSSAMPQEVLAYVITKPEEKDRVLGFCPEMTSAVVNDELSRGQEISDEDILSSLDTLNEKIVQLVQSGEVKLSSIYDRVKGDETQAA